MIDEVFLADLGYWIGADPRVAAKVVALLVDVIRSPMEGIGKPEPLKHHLRGCWSRRITDEHRLIYRVRADHVELMSARRHYGVTPGSAILPLAGYSRGGSPGW